MKKNKSSLFTPIILLSFFLIILTLFINLLPHRSQVKFDEARPSLPLLPKLSFRDFIPRPIIYNTNPIALIAVGDIMLGRYCNVQMIKNKDWKYPFLKTASLTSSAEITFGNLEAPFVDNCPVTETGMIFCTQPEASEGLKYAGFDILSLANNHILNYGQNGLKQTQRILSSSKLLYTPLPSSNNLAKKQVNNTEFGFLSFDLITYPNTQVIEEVRKNTMKADVLIVSLHWGTEYQKEPNEQQRMLAHKIIDAGAKIIIGHHPHVTQPVEAYNNGLIFYSLGNFVFDQPWSEETKKGAIAKIVLEGKKIKFYEIIPVYIENCQPKLLN